MTEQETEAAAIAAGLLASEFGAEWKITPRPGGLRAWTAERGEVRDGHAAVRYLVATTAGELLEKLRALRGEEA